MSSIYYTKDHEWFTIQGQVATVGITDHAQEALGEIVFVDLPAPNDTCQPSEAIAVIESVKAASDIYAPLPGKVFEINPYLEDSPEIINEAAESSAWLFKIQLSESPDLRGFMDQAAYQNYLAEE